MSSIVQPTESQLDTLVAPYLVRQQMGLGFALGYASPEFTPPGNLYFAGNVQNQFGGRLRLDGDTLFELASISKPSQQRCMPCWSAAFLRPKQLATTVERDPAADHHRLAVSFSAGPMVRIRFPPAESRANFISPTGPRDLGQRQGRRGRSAHGRRGYL